MKINNLRIETSTMSLLVPLETNMSVKEINKSTSINLKKEKNNYNGKKVSDFEKLLKKEIDKRK